MKTLLLTTALLFPLAAAAQTVTVTGSNGGTVDKSRSCTRAEGSADCAVITTRTTPQGTTATKERYRSTSAGASNTTVTNTGPGGQTRTRTRAVRW